MTLEPDTNRRLDLESIWAEVGTSMEQFVRRRINDPHQADDVVAEVMLRIHQNLGSLDDHERVTAWVFRIARNAITDHYRRTGRRREVLTDVLEPDRRRRARTPGSTTRTRHLSELASCIRPLVDALPTDYRRALELTDFDGHSQAEAARIEGISLSGMKSRVQRGRRQFATLVKQCCDVTTDSRGELVDFNLPDRRLRLPAPMLSLRHAALTPPAAGGRRLRPRRNGDRLCRCSPQQGAPAMNQFIRPVQITPEAHLIQSFWKAPGAPVGVHINTMVLASREPVVFDTGVHADETGWHAAVSSVVDPDDVRWIVLSHDDHDHTGNLVTAMERFPNATVVASWWMTERLTGSIELDPRRMRWLVAGDTLDIGDRTLVFQRPPIFDSPTTRVAFDPSSGLLWGGDLGGALGPEPVVYVEEMDRATSTPRSFVGVHGLVSPWVAMVDDAKYQSDGRPARASRHHHVGQHPRTGVSGRQDGEAIDLLRQVPSAPPVPEPSQADLDAIVASLLVNA